MNRIPERRRPLFVIAASLTVLLVVAGGVLLIGRLTPTPTPTTMPTSSTTASPSVDPSTPEGAVRALFEAFGQARPTNDPSLVLPFVTSERSPAYLSVSGFLEGQKGLGRAAVITAQRFDDFSVETGEATATVTFSYSETGYLINVDSGEPLGSPSALEPTTIVAEVRFDGSNWLVHEYESAP